MKKVLILSCNTGAGHNSCARSIKEAMLSHGVNCEIEDALRFISQKASNIISNGHVGIYRHTPKIFSKGYAYAETHRSLFAEGHKIYWYLTKASDGIAALIKNHGYDTVICTHPLTALILTDVLKHHDLHIISAFVATDYTCSPTVEQSTLDLCFIPNESLTDEFMSFGYPREKIIPCGIPIWKVFFEKCTLAEAKAKLGIPAEHSHLLMSCGSMGAGPMKKIARLLAERLCDPQTLSIVCGTNQTLYEKLCKEFAQKKNIRVCGYVENMPELMNSADLYIMKPGGISVTEATAKSLPMVFINAVAGCELHNMNFFLKHKCAYTADTPEALADLCISLLKNRRALDEMRSSLSSLGCGNAAEMIYECLFDFWSEEAIKNNDLHTV